MSKLGNFVKIVKVGRTCHGMAWYSLVKILKLHVGSERLSVGSGRLSLGSGRLSGWIGFKSGGWVGQMGGQVRWVGMSGG